MNWKLWKLGLLVATITGICTALVVGAVVPTMSLKEGCFVCLCFIAKDVLLFLKQHPIKVEDEAKTE